MKRAINKPWVNMGWRQITLVLCMFGLLKEFRPSEPFVTDFLTGPVKGFNVTVVTQDIYPIGTYSNLATLFFVFLLTDYLRYKPVVILCGLSGIVTYVVMLFGDSLQAMQFLQFTYGLFMSTEVAYYTYIYAKVDKKHYQVVSSCTRGFFLLGRFLSGLIAQITVSFDIMDYYGLNILTLMGIILATIWACLLPAVEESLYFNRYSQKIANISQHLRDKEETSPDMGFQSKILPPEPVAEPEPATYPSLTFKAKVKRASTFMWRDFLQAYSNKHVLKWSLWWAFATCGYIQVVYYVQPLWKTAVSERDPIYNGAVEALYTIIAALVVFIIGKLRLNWTLLGEVVLSIFSIVEASILLFSSTSYNIWLLYVVYIAFGVIYHSIITVASFEVAKNLNDDSYGLVFGLNTLLALAFQSLLTFIVVDGSVLILDIRTQFQIYAGYFMVLGVGFLVIAVCTLIQFFRSGNKFMLWIPEERDIVKRLELDGVEPVTENPS